REFKGKSLFVDRSDLSGMRHQELAETIPLSPALQRLRTVFRLNRLPVVPSQAVAQCERVPHAIRRHSRSIDHLRLDLKVFVGAGEGVVNKIAVIARDVGGCPYRIEDLQVGLRHEAESLLFLLSADRGRTQGSKGDGRGGSANNLSAVYGPHPRTHTAIAAI